MTYSSYFEMELEADRLYMQKDFQAALKILDDAIRLFPRQFLYAAVYQYLIQAQLGQEQIAIDLLKALHQKGFASPPAWIEKFPDLAKHSDFPAVKAENDRLIKGALTSGQMLFQVNLPDGYSPERKYPLFLVLHGDGFSCDIEYQSWFWKPDVMLARGMIVVYVQSSQVYYPGCFGWIKDYEIAKKDLRACFDQVVEQFSVDPQQVYMGGFSGGAITSTEVALSDALPIKGWIALCPEIKPPSFTRENLERAKGRGLKVVFLEGEQKAWQVDEQAMIDLFTEVGFPHQLVINAGIGHAFPEDLDLKLKNALDFIMARS